MDIELIARELKKRYDKAKINEATLQIHLFGIEYGRIIKENGYKPKDIVTIAGLGSGYAAELSKGIKLSDKVTKKEGDYVK